MRPQNTLDWIAFVFLIIGAFAWGFFVTDINTSSTWPLRQSPIHSTTSSSSSSSSPGCSGSCERSRSSGPDERECASRMPRGARLPVNANYR